MTRTLTTQDVSWFLDLHEKGQLDLEPPYQRRSVWSPRDRRFFIDTVLNNYPAPPVFLHRPLENGRPTYHVVDGKQRLQTVIQFTEGKVRIPDDQESELGRLDRVAAAEAIDVKGARLRALRLAKEADDAQAAAAAEKPSAKAKKSRLND